VQIHVNNDENECLQDLSAVYTLKVGQGAAVCQVRRTISLRRIPESEILNPMHD
jgi:hypothetical protein